MLRVVLYDCPGVAGAFSAPGGGGDVTVPCTPLQGAYSLGGDSEASAARVAATRGELPAHSAVRIFCVVHIHMVIRRMLRDGDDHIIRRSSTAGGDPLSVWCHERHDDGANDSLGSPVNMRGGCRKLDARDVDHVAYLLLVRVQCEVRGSAAGGIGALRRERRYHAAGGCSKRIAAACGGYGRHSVFVLCCATTEDEQQQRHDECG